MKKIIATALMGVAMTAFISSTHAADAANKSYSLDIDVPDNAGTMVGGRMFLDSELALEVSGTFRTNSKDTDAGIQEGTQIVATGGIMKYISHGRVSPYLRAGGGIQILSGDRYNNQDNNLHGYIGVGAEFTITEDLSLRTSMNAILVTSPFSITTTTNDLTLSLLF